MIMRMREVEPTVRMCLEGMPQTRGDDSLLYFRVAEIYAIRQGKSLANISVEKFFSKVMGKEIPSFESVSRARRKLQENHPELRPSEEVIEARAELEDEYMEYALR